ncbi:TetR family transcriptional regulator [Alkalibaculum bacchi]|uniref:TetR family transcriptional regulator n=1 Tax=Alkalibaculum bacchi TaxID=645887 RepID=A0A366HY11_9FIRM|nr:TetR/AcrR family transcriptional regulator [Alkalibaculum bacchi]RBP57112.1 TetR family transcriptional regulator [Alkalibaculum bacchi]
MKREEKNMLKRQQIISSAIAEFGVNSYTEASLNAICKNGNISKGIIYHYFKDKDELYLVCVTECFDRLTTFLNSEKITFNNVEQGIEKYLDLRHQFFKANPDFSNIFTNALLQPPKHLVERIKEIKVGLDKFNINFYEQVLKNVNLKSYVCHEEAIEYFLIFQESFNFHFQNKTYGDFTKLFDEHELKLGKLLKIMFYGIAKEETE